MVLEDPEEPVKAHVDARRLDHRQVIRLQADPTRFDLGPNVTVRQQHGLNLPAAPARAHVA
jgi:hypothetical protein